MCQSFQYIEHNLYDYCTEQYWRDFPGHRTIPVDKSIQIRSPYIFSFNNAVQNQTNRFVHYCRIRLIVGDGKRIYAVGTSSGISTNGNKKWITESIHMSPTKPKLLTKLRIKEDFESTTDNNALELVFEGLDRQEFRFQLVVTPFRQLGNETKCERHVEYKCRNNRCVDAYLVCDYRNNCGDDSDEWHHCLAKLPTTGRPPTRLPTPVLTPPPVYWWPTLSSTTPSPQLTNTTTGAIDDSLNNTLNYYLFHSKLDLRTVVYYILLVLLIIIVVTIINFIVWCIVTKRDQSFIDMGGTTGGEGAGSGGEGAHQQQQQQHSNS